MPGLRWHSLPAVIAIHLATVLVFSRLDECIVVATAQEQLVLEILRQVDAALFLVVLPRLPWLVPTVSKGNSVPLTATEDSVAVLESKTEGQLLTTYSSAGMMALDRSSLV
jgi:hypothetical protein